MPIKQITPLSGPVKATVRVTGSKSITNRALICAALAKGESVIRNASDSDDTALMANGLNQLGVLVRKAGSDLVVHGTGGKLFAPKFPIPVRNAGTTLRFLMGLSAIAQGRVLFEGDFRMADRPSAGLIDALNMLGVESDVLGARYGVSGGTFRGGSAAVSSDLSSQFVSSLLMIAPYALEDVVLELTGDPVSEAYVEMTIEVMRRFGVETVRERPARLTVKSGQRYIPSSFEVETDASGASYFFAAVALTGGDVEVEGTLTSLQGDIRILDLLRQMGCTIEFVENGTRVSASGRIAGIDIDLRGSPDLVPTVAVLGLFAEGGTHIRNVPQLKHKESDRLQGMYSELQKLGASVTLIEDGLKIEPRPLHGAQLDTYDDHRLAMSFALIGLKVPGVIIENPYCVKKSFPRFWEEFEKMTASVERRA